MIIDCKARAWLFVAGYLAGGLVLLQLFGLMGWGLLLAALAAVLLISRPKQLLCVYICWLTVSELALTLYASPLVKWTDEAMTCIMGYVAVADFASRRRLPEGAAGVLRVLAGLLVLAGLSMLANDAPTVGAIHFVLSYFRFFLLFYFVRRFVSLDDGPRFRAFIFAVLALQLALNAGWLFGFNPLPNYRRGTPDFAVGSLESCNYVAYFAIAAVALAMAWFNNGQGLRTKAVAAGLGILGLVQLGLTFTYHAYVLLLGCIGFQLFLVTTRKALRNAIAVGFAPLLLVLILMAPNTDLVPRTGVGQVLAPDRLQSRLYRMRYGVKGKAYRDTLFQLPRDLPFPPVGAGPGNFMSSVARFNRRPLAERYVNYVIAAHTSRYRELSEKGSITGMAHAGVLTLWGELGPLGFLLYWGLHVYAMRRVWRNVRKQRYVDRDQAILAESFVPVILLWMAIGFLADFAHDPFLQGGVWIWAGYVWVPARRQDENTGGTGPDPDVDEETRSKAAPPARAP